MIERKREQREIKAVFDQYWNMYQFQTKCFWQLPKKDMKKEIV